ncbi:MAG TPA: dihydrofolate reductase family protein [Chitinophagaceae bacterium]|nr:dihydrofolate reductase family protein [Chitinophagaceae bacterium]
MGKIILFNMMTLDGYFKGKNNGLDWHHVDEEFNEFAIEQLNSAEGLIFGRLTYELMAGYWQTPEAIANDPIIAGKMNAIPKFVFSTNLDKAAWQNTQLLKGNIELEVKRIKERLKRDMLIFGSASLASKFRTLDLIDEYRIMINPIILGNGEPLFEPLNDRLKLHLVRTKTFHSGNVLLVYEPRRE